MYTYGFGQRERVGGAMNERSRNLLEAEDFLLLQLLQLLEV